MSLDDAGYVRAAGVLGVLKVYHMAPGLVRDGDFVDTLYNMMRDREPQVVINCISTLNEILADEGGIAVNQAIIHYVLNRLREFNDWGQCIVMELVTKYTPVNEVSGAQHGIGCVPAARHGAMSLSTDGTGVHAPSFVTQHTAKPVTAAAATTGNPQLPSHRPSEPQACPGHPRASWCANRHP